MAEYLIEYTEVDRLTKIANQESLGRVMLRDDFTETGGLMTFADPIPKTAEEIAKELAEKAEVQEISNYISGLTDTNVLKTVLLRLKKKGSL